MSTPARREKSGLFVLHDRSCCSRVGLYHAPAPPPSPCVLMSILVLSLSMDSTAIRLRHGQRRLVGSYSYGASCHPNTHIMSYGYDSFVVFSKSEIELDGCGVVLYTRRAGSSASSTGSLDSSMLEHNRAICRVICFNRCGHLRGSSALKQGSLSVERGEAFDGHKRTFEECDRVRRREVSKVPCSPPRTRTRDRQSPPRIEVNNDRHSYGTATSG